MASCRKRNLWSGLENRCVAIRRFEVKRSAIAVRSIRTHFRIQTEKFHQKRPRFTKCVFYPTHGFVKHIYGEVNSCLELFGISKSHQGVTPVASLQLALNLLMYFHIQASNAEATWVHGRKAKADIDAAGSKEHVQG